MSVLQTMPKQARYRRHIDQLLNVQWSTHRGWLIALFCVLGAILVAPVWTVKYPPLVDFPNHLASSFVLAHMHDPRFEFSKFYAPNWQLSPYLTMDLALVSLQKVLPVGIAGRILLTAALVAVPLAAWVFVREANPGESYLAFWSLLLCNNKFFFLNGFINMQLSMALCFLILGLWLRYLKNSRWKLWWALCGLVTLLYFTHIFGFVVAGIVVTCFLFTTKRSVRETIFSWLLFLPGMGCYLYWKAVDAGSWPMVFPSLITKLEAIPAMILGYSPALDFLTFMTLLICLLWVPIDNREFKLNPPWVVAFASLFVVYLVLPNNYGPGTMVAQRILPFIFVAGLAVAKVGRRGAYLVPVALVLFMARTANVETNFISIQPQLQTLADSFSAIPRNTRVLPIIHQSGDAGKPEDYFWSYGVIRNGWYSPYLFHDKGVQPLRLRRETYTLGRYPYSPSPHAAISWSRIAAEYDYIWAYGASAYSKQMARIGRRVFDSKELQVYKIIKLVAKRHQKG